MEMGSKPCQDGFLHPILVQYRKIRKIQVAKLCTPKIIFLKALFTRDIVAHNIAIKRLKDIAIKIFFEP